MSKKTKEEISKINNELRTLENNVKNIDKFIKNEKKIRNKKLSTVSSNTETSNTASSNTERSNTERSSTESSNNVKKNTNLSPASVRFGSRKTPFGTYSIAGPYNKDKIKKNRLELDRKKESVSKFINKYVKESLIIKNLEKNNYKFNAEILDLYDFNANNFNKIRINPTTMKKFKEYIEKSIKLNNTNLNNIIKISNKLSNGELNKNEKDKIQQYILSKYKNFIKIKK